MRRALVLLACLAFLSGCGARTQLSASSNTGGGVTSTSGGVSIQGGSNSFAAALLAISLLAGAIEYSREPRPMPSPSELIPGPGPRAPELAPDRRVAEQDCTKPIDFSAGNLRCK
jgi:hypothetical protein